MSQLETQTISYCVGIATYNNARTLAKVIGDTLNYSENVVVVNDGATDETPEILASFGERITVINHPKNMGKGMALRTAFDWAREKNFDNIITIDSDGQHFPEDIPLFLQAISKEENTLLIGARNMNQDHIPGKSSFGNRFSNFWFWFETGIKLDDTQSGFRLYPVGKMEKRKYWTRKFEFEIEVIVKAAWEGIPVKNIPVQIHYDSPDVRISHFRPFQDFTRISILNTVLVILAFLWYIPIRFTRKLTRKNIQKFIQQQLLNPDESVMLKSTSVGFGIFMGIFPIWGYQLLVGIPLAHFMKMNKALFIVAANISIPPLIPVIIFFSYEMGSFFIAEPMAFNFDKGLTLHFIHENFIQYLIGAIALSFTSGILAFFVTYISVFMARFIRKKKDKSQE